ncbi:MAG: flagellar type III secretion system pore protein FliP [Anaerolineae bacterium]|nr:flagellar type III secretion system pore protein FliP [Anaerolineae bacterium]
MTACGTNAVVVPDPAQIPGLTATGDPQEVAIGVQILLLLTVLSLAPALLVLMTSFTRIVIVLSFVRSAIGTQQVPPNQVLIGLALFLTLFTMSPTLEALNRDAFEPFVRGEKSQQVALREAEAHLRRFMLRQTREKDIALFVNLAQAERPRTPDDLSLTVLVPAFALSELKTAFQMGILIFMPFLVIDMVVSSTLMSMGMMMMPPSIVALPFKLLLFVMVDGWHLTVSSLLASFG